MTANLWRALERLGSTGNAAIDWRMLLADDWDDVRGFLRESPDQADTVIDPDGTGERLSVVADAVSRYLAVSEEEPLREPLPLSDEEVAVLRPDWPAIARELGIRLGFVAADWGSEGVTRQIGIAQYRSELPRSVILHLPAGTFGDQTRLLRDLGRLDNAIVLLPSAIWLSPDVQEIQSRNRLTFITLAEFFDSGKSSFPISTAMRSPSKSSTKRHPPALHPQPGWTWDMVRIEVTTAGRLILSCDGQRKEFTFPKSNRKTHSHGYAIMMHIAVHQEWHNPPSEAPDHEKIRKQFRRLENLLMDLVPLPERPFRRERGGFAPVFGIVLHEDLGGGAEVRR